MDTELFAFTAAGSSAQEHYRRTIENSIAVERIRDYEQGIGADLAALGLEDVRCWGSVPGPGNLRSWERMQAGHWGLLYVGDGRFPLLLKLAHKARSPALAEELWSRNADGKTWELMFFFDEVQPVDLDVVEVRESLGYDESWWPQGLQYPTPEHQETLFEKFGSVEAFAASSGSVVSPADSDGGLSADELLLGGAFTGAPENPPKPRELRQPSDPDAAGRGYLAHERTVEKLAEHVGPNFRKGTPGINHDGAWKSDDGFCISEVKSINARNEVGQLQKGLGQVLHNQKKARWHGIENVRAFLIAEREPVNSQLWQSLCKEHGVTFTWPGEFSGAIPT